MVRVRARAAGEGLRGKLSGDPAVVQTAAVALLHGYDPIRLFSLPADEYELMLAGLAKAEEITAEKHRKLADYVSSKTAGLTARSITRWIARSFRKS